jgi:hypothetical protein
MGTNFDTTAFDPYPYPVAQSGHPRLGMRPWIAVAFSAPVAAATAVLLRNAD